MSILSENQKKVKTVSEIQRWAEKKKKSKEMAKKLHLLGGKYVNRAFRMEQCGDVLVQTVCPVCGDTGTTTAKLCRDRLCPTCQWRLSRARYAQMMQCIEIMKPVLLEEKGFCQMITLTIKNVPLAELKAAIKEMHSAFHNLIRRRPYKETLAWSKNLEITMNKRTREMHPHLHILLFWKGEQRAIAEEAGKALSASWKDVLNIDYLPQTDTRNAYVKRKTADIIPNDSEAIVEAATEAAKYTAKDSDIANMSLFELSQFAEAVSGVRFASYGGLLKKIRSKLGLSDEDYTFNDRVTCHCGAKLMQCVLEWNGTNYEVKALQHIEEVVGGAKNE